MTLLSKSFSPATGGAILMVLAGACFALVNTLVQYGGMVQGIAPARIAFWQYLIAFFFVLPVLFSRGIKLRTDSPLKHALRIAFAAGGVQLWVTGLAHVPIWQAIALIMLSPFFVTTGAGLFLQEKTTPARWFAVISGFVGGMIILAPWSDAFSPYALYPVGAAALWAAASLMTKHLTTTESAESLTAWLLLLLTPINALLALPHGLAPETGATGLLLLGAGALTMVAQYALTKAYSIADAAYLQPFDHVKLPFNVALGLIVFGFAPPGTMWLGSILIIGASFALLRVEATAKTA
jgi:S-adenosylmethionine uptake transporter